MVNGSGRILVCFSEGQLFTREAAATVCECFQDVGCKVFDLGIFFVEDAVRKAFKPLSCADAFPWLFHESHNIRSVVFLPNVRMPLNLAICLDVEVDDNEQLCFQFDCRIIPLPTNHDEREADILARWDQAIRGLAAKLGARSIKAIEFETDDDYSNIIEQDFLNSGPIFPSNGSFPELEPMYTMRWIRSHHSDFPIAFDGHHCTLWTSGRRGQGRATPLNISLASGRIFEEKPEFDWSQNDERKSLRNRIWKIETATDMERDIGEATFRLGGIRELARNIGYGVPLIHEQYVYSDLLPDAVVIVREWEDGMFTALATDIR